MKSSRSKFNPGRRNEPKRGGRIGKSRPGTRAATKPKFVKKSPGAKWKREAPSRPDRKPVSAAFAKKTGAAKLVASLHDKKARNDRKLFLAEGEVTVIEALEAGYKPHSLFVTNEFLDAYPEIKEHFPGVTHRVDAAELTSMGTLAANNAAIGVFHQKALAGFSIGNEIVLALSDVNDPGNLGTLIRIADWYGIGKILASKGTVDAYNPKVISATKGSFARVEVYYDDLEDVFRSNKNVPVIAADMRGQNAHSARFPESGFLLLGNETHGIDEDLKRYVSQTVTIPRFGDAESLNVAIAGAVILDNWKRR